ncbi:hypothetical protein VPIG_00023 [Vibrio phage PWH3a-P1]|uniref:hypothetical protein n=1 Tax=Vibrio phage PWH3a-P1 TaxID=754058 RepID=UPI0002C0B5DC|nr:hypothetical protein VPIG_00023 [Vibrio phage PWH3a-P1]AGH31881.1 hypothetical protein VPIG_00023 [Vibrio phage PWH3a-P1]
MKPKPALESELEWIDNHPEYYASNVHQEQVKKNIYTRYKLTDMLNKLNRVFK